MRRLLVAVAGCAGHTATPPTPTPAPTPAPTAAAPAAVAAVSPPAAPPATAAAADPHDWQEIDVADRVRDVLVVDGSVWLRGEEGVWRSDDGGGTWTRLAGVDSCFELAMSVDHKRLWASCKSGAFVSSDRGNTWKAIATSNTILADDGGTLWAAGDDLGLSRSSDGGKTWRALGQPKQCGGVPATVSFATRTMFLVCADAQLRTSTDRGASWTKPADDNAVAIVDQRDRRIAWRLREMMCLLERSSDGGATWKLSLHEPHQNDDHAVVGCNDLSLPATSGKTAYVAHGGKIEMSTDFTHWQPTTLDTPDKTQRLEASSTRLFARTNDSVLIAPLPHAVPPPPPPHYEPAKQLGPFTTTSEWSTLPIGASHVLVASSTILADQLDGGSHDAPWLSTDEGTTWTSLPMCPGGDVFAASGSRIWVSGCSGPDGTPWPPLASRDGKMFKPRPNALGITILAIDKRGAVIGLQDKKLVTSRDDGETWSPGFAFDLESSDHGVQILVAPPGLWATTEAGAASSRDGGRTWESPEVRSDEPLSLSTLVTDGARLFAMGRCGVWQSTNGARTWAAVFSRPLEFVHDVDVHYAACPPAYSVSAIAVGADGALYSIVGDRVQRGTATLRAAPNEIVSELAVSAHKIILVTNRGLMIAKR